MIHVSATWPFLGCPTKLLKEKKLQLQRHSLVKITIIYPSLKYKIIYKTYYLSLGITAANPSLLFNPSNCWHSEDSKQLSLLFPNTSVVYELDIVLLRDKAESHDRTDETQNN
jgi:hypothetical protein